MVLVLWLRPLSAAYCETMEIGAIKLKNECDNCSPLWMEDWLESNNIKCMGRGS